jgi:hypothetical protein
MLEGDSLLVSNCWNWAVDLFHGELPFFQCRSGFVCDTESFWSFETTDRNISIVGKNFAIVRSVHSNKVMSCPQHHKKYMKQPTELFWTPSDGFGVHTSFDKSYRVTQRRKFAVSHSQRIIEDTFSSHKCPSYPMPILNAESGCGSTDVDEGLICEPSDMSVPSRRTFLSFPDGFWAEMRSSEGFSFVAAGPVSGW